MSEHALPPLMEPPAHCGFPSPAEQYIESPLDLNTLLVQKPAATYFVRVKGDSMEEAGIRENDILIVDRSLEVYDGAIVIAAVDQEFTVKYFYRQDGKILLIPASPHYTPIELTGEHELRLFGVVTACIHQFTGSRHRRARGREKQ